MPLITVRLPLGAALADALRELALSDRDVDCDYGLIAVDPDAGLYALRVTEDAAGRLADSAATLYADPRIDPVCDADNGPAQEDS